MSKDLVIILSCNAHILHITSKTIGTRFKNHKGKIDITIKIFLLECSAQLILCRTLYDLDVCTIL